jgi:hypothetical protein
MTPKELVPSPQALEAVSVPAASVVTASATVATGPESKSPAVAVTLPPVTTSPGVHAEPMQIWPPPHDPAAPHWPVLPQVCT